MEKSKTFVINNTDITIDEEDWDKIKNIRWYLDENRINAKINGEWWKLHNYILNTRQLIDHIDRDGYNNQKSNLRLASKSQNAMNSKLRSDNSSGIKGISWSNEKRKWHAYISVNKKRKFIGYFEDLKEASKSRIEEEIKQFKEFSNFDLIKEVCNKYNFNYEDILHGGHPREL